MYTTKPSYLVVYQVKISNAIIYLDYLPTPNPYSNARNLQPIACILNYLVLKQQKNYVMTVCNAYTPLAQGIHFFICQRYLFNEFSS